MPEMGSLGIRLMSHQCDSFHLYRPQTKLWEGNVFTPVCRSFCSQGGLPHIPGRYPPGRHPSGQTPPVQCMLGYGQQAGSTHPTRMHSCYHPQTKFLHASVSHSVHRGWWYPSMHCGELRGLAWGGVSRPTPRGVYRPTPEGVSRPDPLADGYCCWRYASYWNAFLLFFCSHRPCQ